LKGRGRGLFNALSQHFPRGSDKNYEEPIRIVSVPTEIRKRHTSNTSQEHQSARYIQKLNFSLLTRSPYVQELKKYVNIVTVYPNHICDSVCGFGHEQKSRWYKSKVFTVAETRVVQLLLPHQQENYTVTICLA
jgi:hypothetical protein